MYRRGQIPHLGEHISSSDPGQEAGAGTELSLDDLRQSGEIFTGVELLEICSAGIEDKEFDIRVWILAAEEELAVGSMICLEDPHPSKPYEGRYRFDPRHPWNRFGSGMPGWAGAVDAGLFGGHG
jgi:hypothetical protein